MIKKDSFTTKTSHLKSLLSFKQSVLSFKKPYTKTQTQSVIPHISIPVYVQTPKIEKNLLTYISPFEYLFSLSHVCKDSKHRRRIEVAPRKPFDSKTSITNKISLSTHITPKIIQKKSKVKTSISSSKIQHTKQLTSSNKTSHTETMTIDKLYPILKNENIWNISVSPVHLKGLDNIAKIFGKSRSTLRAWSKEGAPIIFDGVSYYSEYNLLFAWLLNKYRDVDFIDRISKFETTSQNNTP